jgi:hypothetical protein
MLNKISHMNNFCSTIYLISHNYISQHCELYLYTSRRQLNAEWAVLLRLTSKHQVEKWWFGGQQWTGMGEQIYRQEAYGQIGFPVIWHYTREEKCTAMKHIYFQNLFLIHHQPWCWFITNINPVTLKTSQCIKSENISSCISLNMQLTEKCFKHNSSHSFRDEICI